MQDHLQSLRSLIQDKENIIENLMLRYDLGILSMDSTRTNGNLSPDEIQNEELRRKAEALAQRTILENFELREMVNELRDENFHLRNEIYELVKNYLYCTYINIYIYIMFIWFEYVAHKNKQDKINRQVLQINKFENSIQKRMKCKDKQRNKHIQLWLKARNLLKQLNVIKDEKFLRLCCDKIFQLFGLKILSIHSLI